jgi:uncharacterized membrane protein
MNPMEIEDDGPEIDMRRGAPIFLISDSINISTNNVVNNNTYIKKMATSITKNTVNVKNPKPKKKKKVKAAIKENSKKDGTKNPDDL